MGNGMVPADVVVDLVLEGLDELLHHRAAQPPNLLLDQQAFLSIFQDISTSLASHERILVPPRGHQVI